MIKDKKEIVSPFLKNMGFETNDITKKNKNFQYYLILGILTSILSIATTSYNYNTFRSFGEIYTKGNFGDSCDLENKCTKLSGSTGNTLNGLNMTTTSLLGISIISSFVF